MAVVSAEPYANLHLDTDTTTPASHHSVLYRPDVQPTASKHWRLCCVYLSDAVVGRGRADVVGVGTEKDRVAAGDL